MIILSITKFIITTEGVFLLHTEQDKKQIKIITLGELNRRAEDIDTFIGTSEKQYSDKIAAAADSIAQCHKQKPLVLLSGPSGSGKTTLTKLLQGLYPVSQGLIKIDGIDIREIDKAHLRRSIGVVLQENYFFSGTVRANISLTKQNATLEEILYAA